MASLTLLKISADIILWYFLMFLTHGLNMYSTGAFRFESESVRLICCSVKSLRTISHHF